MRSLFRFHQQTLPNTIQILPLLFLLFGCSSFSFSQTPAIDSLEMLFATEKTDAAKLELLQQMTNIAFGIDFKQALIYSQRGVKLAETSNSKDWQPKFYEMHGRMHANLLQLDTASYFFDKAVTGYTAVGNQRGQATTLFKISWINKRKGNLEKSMEADLQALKMMEALEDKPGIADALGRVSEDLMRQGRLQESIEYAQKAITIAEANNLEEELAYAYRNAGDAYIAMEKNEEAYELYNKSYQLFKKLNASKSSLADIINCRGNTLKRMGKYEAALNDYQQVLAFAKESNYPFAISTAIANLGETNLLLGNYSEALPYQLETIKQQEANNDFSNLQENYQHTSTIYEKLGNYQTALQYERKARILQDSSMSVQSDATMSELRTQYETEKKEAVILEQEQRIAQQRLVQLLVIGVAVLLAGFLFFLYRSYQARIKTNQLLAAKNAENELLLKEIHHRVKNNLEIVTSLLELQSSQIDDKDIKDAMLEGQNRVQSIGIVHKKLYQGTNLGSIEMKEYLVNLSESILDSYGAEERITIECAMEQLEVDIDTAVPLGLIVNELLTNTLKYAFPEGQKGNVRIELKKENDGILYLEVADNGIGKSGIIKGTGFGSQLVSLLTQ